MYKSTKFIDVVDEFLFQHTNKTLNDLQKAIIIGSLENKKYQEIADENIVTESHVNQTAYELWSLLSQLLNTKVKKANIKSTIDKILNSNVSHTNNTNNDNGFLADTNNYQIDTNNVFQINQVNLCSNTANNQSNTPHNNLQNNNQSIFKEHLTDLPVQDSFYGRNQELKTLTQKIIEDKVNLVSILGVMGIGKTALTIKLIEQIKTHFNYVIYLSLNTLPTLTEITENLITFIHGESKTDLNINTLKKYLSNNRCLIILDDVERIFSQGKLSGNYQTGYEDYGDLFPIITQSPTESCFILVSQELPLELVNLSANNPYYHLFLLTGLGESAQEILREKELLDEDKWDELIGMYEGNPLYLKLIADSIQDFCDGSVIDFLAENELIIPLNMQHKLQSIFNKLSPIEQKIIRQLSNFDQPLSTKELNVNLDLSLTDLISGLESFLVTKIKEDKTLFQLSSVVREYVKND